MCVWGRYFAQKARQNRRFDAPRRLFCLFFAKTGITLDTYRNFASASNPTLKRRKPGKKAAATACLAIAVVSNFNAKNFDFERSPSTPRRVRQRLRRRASRLRTRRECAPKARCPMGGSLCGNRDSSRGHRARKRGSARRSAPSRRRAR